MANPDDPLWNEIDDLQFGEASALYSFSARLANENGWPSSYADRVVLEYRRFLYLTAQTDHVVTPSDQVDQAWHLHLAYSRHYWDKLCGDVLKKPLHHNPTEGGPKQRELLLERYERALSSYRKIFCEEPPTDIWPPASQRFSRMFRRIDITDCWVLPRPSIPGKWVTPLVGGSVFFAVVSYSLAGSPIVALAFIAFVMVFAVAPKTVDADHDASWSYWFHIHDNDNDTSGDSDGSGSGCGGD